MQELRELESILNSVLVNTEVLPDGTVEETSSMIQDNKKRYLLSLHPENQNPAHFRVVNKDLEVKFDLENCNLLKIMRGRLDQSTRKKIKHFHKLHKSELRSLCKLIKQQNENW